MSKLACYGLRVVAALFLVSALAATSFAADINDAPEVDPGSMASALALLATGGMFAADRLMNRFRARA